MQQMLIDLGQALDLRLHSDSSAGIGVCSRRCAAGIRHMAVQTLWVQQLVAKRKLKVLKIPGDVNTSDIGTKVLDSKTLLRLLGAAGFRFV